MSSTAPTAALTGTCRQPVVRLRFAKSARTPSGGSVLDWVRGLPGRRFDREKLCWDVYGLGADPQRALERAGFVIDLAGEVEDDSLEDVLSLDDVTDPLCKLSVRNPRLVLVRPRLAGYELARERLGPSAQWERGKGRFTVPAAHLIDESGKARPGLVLDDEILAAAQAAKASEAKNVTGSDSLATALSMEDAGEAGGEVKKIVGDVPDWFGADLYPYQEAGALAAAGGHRLIADEPGLGKSFQALAALSIGRQPRSAPALKEMAGTERIVIVAPPVALTHWKRETETSGLLKDIGGEVAMFIPGRKEPELPTPGVVVISDSLLASREKVLQSLIGWQPQGLIVDEIHREKNWTASRTRAVMQLAEATDGPRYGISGTPMFANPQEMAAPLAITGQLVPVFGGRDEFLKRFCRKNTFNAWVPRKNKLGELRRILDAEVWVRRRKDDVLDNLPGKVRQFRVVDVDLRGFRQAHAEVRETIREWLTGYAEAEGRWPTPKTITSWAKQSLGLLSPLRQAAGLAKVEAAAEYVAQWVEQMPTSTGDDDETVFDRPLIVWTHHNEVTDAMIEAVPASAGGARVIRGGTSEAEKAEIVDAFQAGRIPVLVASITAAGVAITLTRASEALFVETDWTPALIQQAEDRLHRISQDRAVTITTMVAPGTLDERIQRVLATKGKILTEVLGDGQDVSVAADLDSDEGDPAVIVAEIARDELRKLKKKATPLAKAA